ncbi:MAG: hypothetical protein WCC84_14190 [Candidatus Cybelea sp.]
MYTVDGGFGIFRVVSDGEIVSGGPNYPYYVPRGCGTVFAISP